MISDAKLQLILTLYKNDKLTFEEVKTLLQEEKPFTGPFQPFITNPWERIGTGAPSFPEHLLAEINLVNKNHICERPHFSIRNSG